MVPCVSAFAPLHLAKAWTKTQCVIPSGNGSVAAFIARHKHAGDATGSYVAEQGIEIDRDGEIHASWEREGEVLRIRIGGEAAVSASGELHL